MPLAQVWREVCRHVEIGEAAERVARVVAAQTPLRALLVRRLDAARMRLDTVACARLDSGAPYSERSRLELNLEQLRVLQAWCAAGQVRRGRSGEAHPVLELVVPAGVTGDVIVGPLLEEGVAVGVLVLVGARHAFSREEEELVQQLTEPMAVALANDVRLHEMNRLREALEADKQALLWRLGRQEIAEAIVGAEAGLRTVMERVAQVAATDVPVLLLGETGTGKEVIARELHRRSARARGPVVRVNCGAIPAGLVDSELFGHERGSFTGAVAARAGWFERADGGTLFLDEIGELSPDAQVRLLRILQDGTFERVGGERTLRVDVRVVAASHRDLHAMVQAGTFREDLWYRIGVFPIRLPPLRERQEDIAALAAHFAAGAGRRLGGVPLVPAAADAELLRAYAWPGNVRELAAVIERAAILGGGHRLEIAAALGVVAPAPRMAAPPRSEEARASDQRGLLTMDEAMRHHIEGALRTTRGRIEGPDGAAVLLGINPHTLRARMRRLGVRWSEYRLPAHTRS